MPLSACTRHDLQPYPPTAPAGANRMSPVGPILAGLAVVVALDDAATSESAAPARPSEPTRSSPTIRQFP